MPSVQLTPRRCHFGSGHWPLLSRLLSVPVKKSGAGVLWCDVMSVREVMGAYLTSRTGISFKVAARDLRFDVRASSTLRRVLTKSHPQCTGAA